MRFRTVVLLLSVLLICDAGLVWNPQWRPAYRWNPWAPLDVREPRDWLTAFRLWRLRQDPALCAQALAFTSLRQTPLADTAASARCPLRDVVRVSGGDVALSSSFIASCPLAVSFALFERQELQPAARASFGEPVARVDHLGSFACRNIYGRENGRRSEHASANALDLAGFRFASSRRISVAADWQGDGAAARFLRQVREGACRSFRMTLSPDYNAAHHDHLHVDMGGFSVCR